MIIKRLILLAFATLMIAACSGKDPGPLAGTWKSSIGTTIQFRTGESVADGIVNKVTYKISGNSVKVVHTGGQAKGSAATFTIIDADNAKTEYLTLKRIK